MTQCKRYCSAVLRYVDSERGSWGGRRHDRGRETYVHPAGLRRQERTACVVLPPSLSKHLENLSEDLEETLAFHRRVS
jgi:hypothetical protein